MKRHFLLKVYYILTVPVSIMFILKSSRIRPEYGMTWIKRFKLGFKMFFNSISIPTGTSYKAHLAMALKLLEMPPSVQGIVIECGSWKGGSTANLSLVCKIVGRKLKVFDSFEGLPAGEKNTGEALKWEPGSYLGTLEEVKENIRKHGVIEQCEFVKGWYKDTLQKLSDKVALAFLDVDVEVSLHECVLRIWPNLVEGGYIFTDECVNINYIALFYSEKWWKKYFNTPPPGLIGAGTGLPLGEYYIGPFSEIDEHPLQHGSTGAFTMKGMSGVWTYYPN